MIEADGTAPRMISEAALAAALSETLRAAGSGALYVFGYGSLAWRPGFRWRERWGARVFGWSRRLCVRSLHYRGTPERPGLVFGLDAGGSCAGTVYRVSAGDKAEVARYLFRREMFMNVYRPRFVTARPLAGAVPGGKAGEGGAGAGGVGVRALTFVARRDHSQYSPPLPEEETLRIIRGARGKGGGNREYILNTVEHLRELGVSCPGLERLGGRL